MSFIQSEGETILKLAGMTVNEVYGEKVDLSKQYGGESGQQ
jgi:hypothetical protein